MKNTAWFYTDNTEICLKHRKAYEKSLKSKNAVKVISGVYYYRGFEISKDGGSEYPWNYNKPENSDFDREAATTKKEAMAFIDDILSDNFDLCDIMCR